MNRLKHSFGFNATEQNFVTQNIFQNGGSASSRGITLVGAKRGNIWNNFSKSSEMAISGSYQRFKPIGVHVLLQKNTIIRVVSCTWILRLIAAIDKQPHTFCAQIQWHWWKRNTHSSNNWAEIFKLDWEQLCLRRNCSLFITLFWHQSLYESEVTCLFKHSNLSEHFRCLLMLFPIYPISGNMWISSAT